MRRGAVRIGKGKNEGAGAAGTERLAGGRSGQELRGPRRANRWTSDREPTLTMDAEIGLCFTV